MRINSRGVHYTRSNTIILLYLISAVFTVLSVPYAARLDAFSCSTHSIMGLHQGHIRSSAHDRFTGCNIYAHVMKTRQWVICVHNTVNTSANKVRFSPYACVHACVRARECACMRPIACECMFVRTCVRVCIFCARACV